MVTSLFYLHIQLDSGLRRIDRVFESVTYCNGHPEACPRPDRGAGTNNTMLGALEITGYLYCTILNFNYNIDY